MKKIEEVIPKGLYCYERLEAIEGSLGMRCVNMCPFWNKFRHREEQVNGYCLLLQKGDWGDNGTMLLWDQVKECGINYDMEYELEHATPMTMPCKVCGQFGVFRYAPYDFENNWKEEDRWRCEQHAPYNIHTLEGWDGEWDYFGEVNDNEEIES